MATQDIFENIYRNKLWGGRKWFWQRFYSGSGSRGKAAAPYVKAVAPLISGKIVVDLGCGDFSVGNRICWAAKKYIGCDIVRSLIERNDRKFHFQKNVEFLVCDAIEDELPDGEVVLVRQVLQHLDNASVAKVLAKLSKYQMAIITEHIPAFDFVPNRDMEIGAGNRTFQGSGLVLTAPPFSLPPGQILCEMPQHGGLIRTMVHYI